ncbi:hypothetical protein G8G22_004917 [Escherichia coli]|nr:hypothetical protein [Escherichia coli]
MVHAFRGQKLTSIASGNREQKLVSAGSVSIEQKLTSIASDNREQKLASAGSASIEQKSTSVASGNREQKLVSAGSASIEQKLTSIASGNREQKLASAGSVTKEQKLCCISSMEGGGTEYPGTSDGKPPKPGVSRERPDRMQSSPQSCQILFVSGKSQHCIKGPEDKIKTRILVAVFLVSILSALKF